MTPLKWRVENPSGHNRVIVTKELPGERWLQLLNNADCRVEICQSTHVLETTDIKDAIGNRCDGAIGQLTENWGEELFSTLKAAGGRAYSNYAVGYNNVELEAGRPLLKLIAFQGGADCQMPDAAGCAGRCRRLRAALRFRQAPVPDIERRLI